MSNDTKPAPTTSILYDSTDDNDEDDEAHVARPRAITATSSHENDEKKNKKRPVAVASAWAPSDSYYPEPDPLDPQPRPSREKNSFYSREKTQRTKNLSRSSRSRGGVDDSIQEQQHNDDNDDPNSQQSSTTTTTWDQPATGHHRTTTSTAEPSLPDRLAGLAVAGTLEFLKLAGGLTLNTTATLAAPPIHMARVHLLPVLWQASLDSVSNATPDRVKDWFRIFSSSVRHFFSVLRNTDQGQIFRQRLLILWFSLIDVVASETTRQVLLDGTASWVKFWQVLNTAECHAWTDQMAIWACRLIQAAADGKNQELVHQAAATMKSLSQLLADPHTTTALAEVVAYLCHALEMQENQSRLASTTATTTTTNAERAKRRHERNQYQTQTHIDRITTTHRAPHRATVEQVILSSLGALAPNTNDTDQPSITRGDDEGSVAASSVPSRVVYCRSDDRGDPDEKGDHDEEEDSRTDWDQGSSIRQQVDEELSQGNRPPPVRRRRQRRSTSISVQARKDVNVEFLRQQIQAGHISSSFAAVAAAAVKQQRCSAKGHDDDDSDVDHFADNEGDNNNNDLEGLAERKRQDDINRNSEMVNPAKRMRTLLQDAGVLVDPKEDDPFELPSGVYALPKEGETPVEHFYRILNEILNEKRNEVIQGLGDGSKQLSAGTMGRVKLHPKSQHDKSQADEIPTKNKSLRERILEVVALGEERTKSIQVPKGESKRLVLALLLVGSLVVLTWFGLGCFGLYTILIRPHSFTSGPAVKTNGHASPGGGEVIVRVIREVVHVDANGNYIGQGADTSSINPDQMDRIAGCVTDAVN